MRNREEEIWCPRKSLMSRVPKCVVVALCREAAGSSSISTGQGTAPFYYRWRNWGLKLHVGSYNQNSEAPVPTGRPETVFFIVSSRGEGLLLTLFKKFVIICLMATSVHFLSASSQTLHCCSSPPPFY
jgi:hypothetical protein